MATVGSIVGGAFDLVKRRPGAVAIWAVTYIIGSVVIFGLMGLMMGGGMMMAGPVNPNDPTTMAQIGGGFFGAMLLTYLLYGLLSIVLINAVYRAILRPQDDRFASMRLGGDEFRMLGLTILFIIGMIILYLLSLLGMFLLAAIVGLVSGGSQAVAGILGILLGLGFFALWIWLSVRLSLIFPMTFYRRRFAIDEGWALGAGRFWTLLGSYFIVWVAIIAVMMIFFWSMFGGLFALMGSGGDPAATQVAMEQMMMSRAAAGVGGLILSMVGMTIVSILAFVLGYGVVGSAARELLEESGDVTEEDAYRTAEVFE